jgi:hypothetical protein
MKHIIWQHTLLLPVLFRSLFNDGVSSWHYIASSDVINELQRMWKEVVLA